MKLIQRLKMIKYSLISTNKKFVTNSSKDLEIKTPSNSSYASNSNFNFANIIQDNSELQKNEIFLDNFLMKFRSNEIRPNSDDLKNLLNLNKSQFNQKLEKEIEDFLFSSIAELRSFSLSELSEILVLASSINFELSNKSELLDIEKILIEKLENQQPSGDLNNNLLLLLEALITVQYQNLSIFDDLFNKTIQMIKTNFLKFEEIEKLKLGTLLIFFNSNNMSAKFSRYIKEIKADNKKNISFLSENNAYNKNLFELLLMYSSHITSSKYSDLFIVLIQMFPKIVFDKCLLGNYSKTELLDIMNKNSEIVSNYVKNLEPNINNQQIQSILLSNMSNYLIPNETLLKNNLEKSVIYSAGLNNEVILETVFLSLREINDMSTKDINYLKALIKQLNISSITGSFNKSKSLTGIIYRKQIHEIDTALYELSMSLKVSNDKVDDNFKKFIGRFIVFYPFSGIDYQNEVKMIYKNWKKL